jgi:hypothetical protein
LQTASNAPSGKPSGGKRAGLPLREGFNRW